MNKYLFLIIIIFIIFIIIALSFFIDVKEGFSFPKYDLETPGLYPKSQQDRVLDFYPSSNKMGVSNDNSYQIWWHYPIFKVGSYEQITNNIRYPNNPDEGTCMRAEMCGALYKNNQEKSNITSLLPPTTECAECARVNYYNTVPNMLPFTPLKI
jgi:hypothetical protein